MRLGFLFTLLSSYIQHKSKPFYSAQKNIVQRFWNVFHKVWATWNGTRKRENKIHNISVGIISNKVFISLSVQLKSCFILLIWLSLTLLVVVIGTSGSILRVSGLLQLFRFDHMRTIHSVTFCMLLSILKLWSFRDNNISEENLSPTCELSNMSNNYIIFNFSWKLFFY